MYLGNRVATRLEIGPFHDPRIPVELRSSSGIGVLWRTELQSKDGAGPTRNGGLVMLNRTACAGSHRSEWPW
jgi:hypothetical protein